MSSESDEKKDEETKASTATSDEAETGDDEGDEEVEASGADESDEDEDEESDEDEIDEEDDGEGGESRVLVGSPDDQPQPIDDTPRNRAERRLRSKQDRRGQTEKQRKELEAEQEKQNRRVRLPPKTVSGKSSADEVPPWARKSADWLSKNGKGLVAGVVVVLAVAGGAVFWQWRRENTMAKAATAYTDAVQLANAPIRAADAPPDPPGTPPRRTPTFPDRAARAQAALRAFRDVENRYPSSPVTPLAKLSEAATLYDLARYAEAKTIYESLLHSDIGGQDSRVLENLGFTLEALNDNAGALTRYQELGRIQDGAFRDLAAYHQARVEQKLGHNDRARDLLHGVIERLRRTSTDEEFGTGGVILEGARSLLRDIAPEDPLATAETPNRQDPAALQRIIQQLGGRARMVPPGGAGGAGGAPIQIPGGPGGALPVEIPAAPGEGGH